MYKEIAEKYKTECACDIENWDDYSSFLIVTYEDNLKPGGIDRQSLIQQMINDEDQVVPIKEPYKILEFLADFHSWELGSLDMYPHTSKVFHYHDGGLSYLFYLRSKSGHIHCETMLTYTLDLETNPPD